jgi:hypothetical protein
MSEPSRSPRRTRSSGLRIGLVIDGGTEAVRGAKTLFKAQDQPDLQAKRVLTTHTDDAEKLKG